MASEPLPDQTTAGDPTPAEPPRPRTTASRFDRRAGAREGAGGNGRAREEVIRLVPTREGNLLADLALREERRLRERAEAAEQRARFLARAGELLSSSLDWETTLASLASLAVPAIGDWCAVDILERDGAVRRLAVNHSDPAKVRLAHELQRRYPGDPASTTGLHEVLRSGRAQHAERITDEILAAGARDAEHGRILRELGLRSYVIAPLVARGETLGALTIVTAESGRTYGADDVALAEELARRAALAMDNARAHRALQESREELERQTLELELQAAQLQETAAELEERNAELEAANAEAEAQVVAFRMLAESIPQLVWTTDAQGSHDYCNAQWYDYTGMPREGQQGWNWRNFLHPDDCDRTFEAWNRSLASGEPYEVAYRFRRASDGGYRWFIGRALPMRDAQGRVARWFGTCTDIDDQKRAEETRDRALKDAERANRAKAEFLASMSHELRTPLNAIGGYAELLELGLRGPVSEPQKKDLARIQRAQKHLLSLVNDILNFAKLEAGGIELEIEEVRILEVLAGIEAVVDPIMRAKGLRYELMPYDRRIAVRADREKLTQVMINILTNAAKFTEAGVVRVECAAEDAWVEITVTDTGRGIPADKLETIFEPFVQVDRRSHSGGQQGVGLGLAISRDLARAMNGDVQVTSTMGEGSRFVVRMPRAK